MSPTDEKEYVLSKSVLAIVYIVFDLIINILAIAGCLKILSAYSYAFRTMAVVIVFLILLIRAIFGCYSNLGLSNIRIITRIVTGIVACLVFVIAVCGVILYYVYNNCFPLLTADIAHTSYEIFRFLGKDDDAKGAMEEVIALMPEYSSYKEEAGDFYFEIGDYTTSISYYEEIIKVVPEVAETYPKVFDVNRDGKVSIKELDLNGDGMLSPEEAKIFIYYPENAYQYIHRLLFKRGCVYLAMGDFEKAISDLSVAVENHPENIEYNAKYAQVCYHYGRDTGNKEYYRKVINSCSVVIDGGLEDMNCYYWRGRSCLQLDGEENSLQAVSDFTRLIQCYPGNDEYYYWRGKAYVSLNRYSCLENIAGELAEKYGIYPEDDSCCLWGGVVFELLHKDDNCRNAVRDFTIAIKNNPLKKDYFLGRAEAYDDLGEYNW